MTLSPIHNLPKKKTKLKLNTKLPSPKMIKAPIVLKNSCNSFKM